MEGDLVINTGKLREQAEYYNAEMRRAEQLAEELRRAERLSPENSAVFRKLIREAQTLSGYYAKMAQAAADLSEAMEKTSFQIREQFEENIYGN